MSEHRPTEEPAARLTVFRRWRSSTTAARSLKVAGRKWASHADEVMAALSTRTDDAVLFTLKPVSRAWELAQALALDDDRTWTELINAYEKVEPIATLPIHRRVVERELIDASAQHHRLAARRLARTRKLSAGTEDPAGVEDLIAGLREMRRRQPRSPQELDRAGLP